MIWHQSLVIPLTVTVTSGQVVLGGTPSIWLAVPIWVAEGTQHFIKQPTQSRETASRIRLFLASRCTELGHLFSRNITRQRGSVVSRVSLN